MASRTITELIADTDGKKADETVTFGLDGRTYEIDLTTGNVKSLRDTLAPYVSVASRGGGRSRRSGGGTTTWDPAESQAIREWALASGYEVSDRGRISAEIVEAYDNAPDA
jgi:hypothetical protein